jgi:hypothetical protein
MKLKLSHETGVDWHGRRSFRLMSRLRSPVRRLPSFRKLDPQSTIVEVHDRLMFDAVVSGRSRTQDNLRYEYYNGHGLRLRYGLARSTISQSRDTKREVDQGREIAKIALPLICEGQAGNSASLI